MNDDNLKSVKTILPKYGYNAKIIPTKLNMPNPNMDITYANINTNMNTPISLGFSFSIKLINVLVNSDGML